MEKITYAEKLQDSRWENVRDEIRARDADSCQHCGSSEFLEVHHCYYDGKEPWDYEHSSLLTLCRSCHKYETLNLDRAKKSLCDALSLKGWKANWFYELGHAVRNLHLNRTDDEAFSAFVWAIQKPEIIKSIIEFYQQSIRKARKND